MSKWLFFPTAAVGGSDWTDYMTANAGTDYWTIPVGTGSTIIVSVTAGDGSNNFSSITDTDLFKAGTTQSGTVVTAVTYNARGISGPFGTLNGPYQWCAIGFPEVGIGYLNTKAAGWIILEREQTPGGISAYRQGYIAVEGNDGMVTDNGSSTYIKGQLPPWSAASTNSKDMVLFFFNNYNSGDVQNWTIYDGTTTP